MLKIYGRANSINVRKVLWACGEMDIAYERFDFGRGFEATDSPTFRDISEFRVVPVVDDDGFILRESNVIVRYLAEKHGRDDLLPTDSKDRYTVEAWMDWSATDLYAEVRPVFQGIVFKLPQFDDPDIIATGITGWTRQMHLLEAHMQTSGDYVWGNRFTVADIPIGLSVNRWYQTPFDGKPDFAKIKAYYERLKTRTPFQEHGANGLP